MDLPACLPRGEERSMADWSLRSRGLGCGLMRKAEIHLRHFHVHFQNKIL